MGTEVVLRAVEKTYGRTDVPVVKGLTHNFSPRKLHVIAGASGSGKTTVLNLIAALEHPDAGEILVSGQPVDKLNATDAAALRRECIGYVSQHSSLVEHLSVKENIELGLGLRGIDTTEAARRATAWLEWIGLKSYATRRAGELSGGEQRRVALARALAPRPALLLADEPTAHLDQLSGRLVIRLLRAAVKENGTTIIAATHDPDVIAAADMVLRIDSPATNPSATEQPDDKLLL
ncbi:MAG: ABC transporter ATP-binding protein [Acidimicrobiales bacterium]